MFGGKFRGAYVIGAAFAACLAAQAAVAGNGHATTRSVRVAYGDLDLGTASGQAALHARIDAAARQACSPHPAFDVNNQLAHGFLGNDFAKCRAEAMSSANNALRNRGVRVAVAY